MAQRTRKNKEPAAPLSVEALAAKVRDALQGKGLKAAELAKAIGKADAQRGLQLARDRAAAGEIWVTRSACRRRIWLRTNAPAGFGPDPLHSGRVAARR